MSKIGLHNFVSFYSWKFWRDWIKLYKRDSVIIIQPVHILAASCIQSLSNDSIPKSVLCRKYFRSLHNNNTCHHKRSSMLTLSSCTVCQMAPFRGEIIPYYKYFRYMHNTNTAVLTFISASKCTKFHLCLNIIAEASLTMLFILHLMHTPSSECQMENAYHSHTRYSC